MQYIIHTDGGARGNPGPAAVGVVIEEVMSSEFTVHSERKLIIEFGKTIGETTNNVAEYRAVGEALMWIKCQGSSIKDKEKGEIHFYLDSLLVVQQLNGVYKIKESHLRELFFEIQKLIVEVGGVVRFSHIPRAENARADFLVNQALDR